MDGVMMGYRALGNINTIGKTDDMVQRGYKMFMIRDSSARRCRDRCMRACTSPGAAAIVMIEIGIEMGMGIEGIKMEMKMGKWGCGGNGGM